MTWQQIIALGGTIMGIFGIWAAWKRNNRSDNRAEGAMQSDIGYIKGGVDDLKREMRESNGRHYHLAERVTAVEESAKQAHKRIDEMNR
jgi:hypothetical protein